MRRVSLLDCTLRDGGYINNWEFGLDQIKGYCKKIAQTGIEILEIGFIKDSTFNPNRTVFPDIASIEKIISPKNPRIMYVGMLDMSAPVSEECIKVNDGTSIDGIRVIFKKDKIDEAYRYCKIVQDRGYKLFVNFVGTDLYSDLELISAIKKFNDLKPYAMSIVDSFGLIKRKHFLRLVLLMDHNMDDGITLCYHAHNNLQQAMGNAESLLELNLKRDICIDVCIFGMGRGAGNLNAELFAEYMNENYNTNYQIVPMLEIMDEYLADIYKERFWGYSLPFYLSASYGCHPNYAVYFEQKDTLTVKSFEELLRGIPQEEKATFSKESAEKYYKKYMMHYVDDRDALQRLTTKFAGRNVVLLAPGRSINQYKDIIASAIISSNAVVIAVNYTGKPFDVDFIFSGNMRRVRTFNQEAEYIVTSNISNQIQAEYVVNFSSYCSDNDLIYDNSGLMLLKLLSRIGVNQIQVAGMDGYTRTDETKSSSWPILREKNRLIAEELRKLMNCMEIRFITPTEYFSEELF